MPPEKSTDQDKTIDKRQHVLFGAEVGADSYDIETHIVAAIKVGTVAHTSYGEPWVATNEWLSAHASDWTNGAVIANHNGQDSEKFGSILKSWYEAPFVMMEIGNMNEEAERRMLADEHTGFSFDAIGDPYYSDDIQGTNLSILFYPHYPACPATAGCGLAADDGSSLQTDDFQTYILGSAKMAEYTDAEIASMKADVAEVATLRAEASTSVAEKVALVAELAERTDKIATLVAEKAELFTDEGVAAQVVEAQKIMFSAEDMEAAKTEAITEALAAEKTRSETLAAELIAIEKMFPDGLDTEFKTELVAMVTEGKLHEAIVKLGDIEYKTLKASIPAATGVNVAAETDAPDTGFTVGDCKGV